MTQKVQAIVIKSNSRKEKDKNILLFSAQEGKFWAILKGVKNATSKMKLAQNPFTFGEFIIEDGRYGKIVTGFEPIETFHELAENVDKYFEATAILEILNVFDFSTTEIFVLALKCLKALVFKNIKTNYILCKFLIEIFKLSGFSMYVEKCSTCKESLNEKIYFDFSTGEFVCPKCKNFFCKEVPKVVYMALKILENTDFERLVSVKLSDGSETELLHLLADNFVSRFEKTLKFVGVFS